MKIGNLSLKSLVVAAPMAGVTDAAFRTILAAEGAGLLTTEMVSAKGLFYNNKNSAPLIEKGDYSAPTALQLFGSDPLIMARMAEKMAGDYDIIDVNMGCPMPKIVRNGEGSALMLRPDLAYNILDTMVRVTDKPVTVKIRSGFDEAHINAVEFAVMAEQAGVSAITVHGRTRSQMYSGRADRGIIRRVKQAVGIPVIGNGDIFTPEDAESLISETGADGVALARGLRGNPWLMGRTVQYLETGTLPPPPDMAGRKRMMLRHIELMESYKGPRPAVLEMRKHLSFYVSGLAGKAALRQRFNGARDIEELKDLVEAL